MKFPWYIWIPRIIIILLILWLTLFTLDAFNPKNTLGQNILALIKHNIFPPTLPLLLMLILTWKQPLWGGIILLLLGTAFNVMIVVFMKRYHVTDFLFCALPILIAAVLFFLAHYYRTPIEIPSETPSKSESAL